MPPPRLIVPAAFAALCCVAALAYPADWPRFRGPGGQGVSDEKGVPLTWSADKNVRWKVELPGPGASSPVVLGERIFVTGYGGFNVPGRPKGRIEDLTRHVACLERKTGKLLWSKDVKCRLPDQVAIRHDHGYASSTPVADAGRVYAFFGISGVFAFDHDGTPLWHADVGAKFDGFGTAASLSLFGDLLLVNASIESEALVALDRKTGKEVWRARGIKESWNVPLPVTVDGKTELVLAMTNKLLGIDPASGDVLWTYTTNVGWYMVPCLVTDGSGVIYCTGGRDGYTSAVRAGGRGDVTKTHGLWTIKKGSNVTSPIIHDGHLYWMNDALGVAFCAEAKSGRIVYEERTGAELVYASPILVEGRLYYTDNRGRTYVLPARPEYKVLAQNDLPRGARVDSSIAVSDGCLLMRANQYLYCFAEGR